MKTTARNSGSLRRQFVVAAVSVQCILVLGFVALLVWQDISSIQERQVQRLRYQAAFLAASVSRPLAQGNTDLLAELVNIEREAGTIRDAQITDRQGRSLANTNGALVGRETLNEEELQSVQDLRGPMVLNVADANEAVSPVMWQGKPIAFAWVYPNNLIEREQITRILFTGFLYVLLAIGANWFVALAVARSVLKPVNALVSGTRKVADGANPSDVFPLRIQGNTEIGELTDAFNDMVDTLEKQRAGLHDTLALLDSMLSNAPVGFGFLDHKHRFVRINQHLADMNGQPVSKHLGRPVAELWPRDFAIAVEQMSSQVFETGHALRDFEYVSYGGETGNMRSWILNFFPVRSSGEKVRWVGVIVIETTERKQTEETLRRSEKLAATGRLAASIAHEINNPLEGVTNLIYLLSHHRSLDAEARRYAEMAQHELTRVSEITQQTLRFYKQSTLPVNVSMSELVQSVLLLYQGKILAAGVTVVTRFREPVTIVGFSGELRQLLANLIGNALDAMANGGRLFLCAKPSQDWRTGEPGVRLVCADSGTGMSESVRRRIFEPFFTTKEATGTGLGLWVSAEIVAKHHAHIKVRSRASAADHSGSGTVFMVFLPETGPVQQQASHARSKAEVSAMPT